MDLNRGPLVVSAVLCLCANASISAQTPDDQVLQNPDGLVRHIYDLVTFQAGTTPDWDRVRSMFIDDAVIVLRTSKDSTTVFSVDGFVDDFVAFIERANAERTGFTENIIRMESM